MSEPGGPFLEEQERRRKIEEETVGGALRKIQGQLNEVKGEILAALGDHVLTLALWIYFRAGRDRLAWAIAEAKLRSATGDLAALIGEPAARESQKRHDHLTEQDLEMMSSRTDVGHAMLDSLDERVRAFFEAHPGELATVDLGHGTRTRRVSEEDWPAMRQRFRDLVVAVGRREIS